MVKTPIRPILKIGVFVSLILIIPVICDADQLRVVRVTDGDTIKAVSDHMEIIVRLVGIDAPETSKKKNEPGQPYSRKATKHLASLVLNKTITIKEYGADRYGRILGVVFVDGTNANLEMIKAGLAEVYRGPQPRYFNVKIYQDAEAEAQKAKRNMWSLGDKYISPREWRRGKRN
jgi:endonuclease YncB( thermonuclease family)